MNDQDLTVIGIGGHVLALDPATGTEVWRTKLKGSDFVTVSIVGGKIYAAAGGELFCLDLSTGQVLWNNRLKGLGTGLVSLASGSEAAAAATIRKKQAARAAGAVAASS